MAGKKTVTVKETMDEEQEKRAKETLFCVKVKRFGSDGFLKEMKTRRFFKTEKEARKYYNGLDDTGWRIELSKYTSGNEHLIDFKDC